MIDNWNGYRISFDRINRELGFDATRTVEDGIIEVADFGGDFFQQVNGGFNPIADTIKLADFTTGTVGNTFLNLVSQKLDDVDYNYDAIFRELTLTFSSSSVDVDENYTQWDLSLIHI